MIDFEGWTKHEEQAKKQDTDGKSMLCTERWDSACTYCHKYWNCPYLSEESED